jgi:hypothetical protein
MSPALDCSSPAQRSFHANWRNLSNVFGETSAFTVNIVALFVVFSCRKQHLPTTLPNRYFVGSFDVSFLILTPIGVRETGTELPRL